jgi:hypothetical protein
MSKLVIWGHWVVGLIFASVAAECVWEIVGALIIRGARFGPRWPDAAFLIAVSGVVFGLCSWGILKWRPWGHALAIGVSAFEAFVGSWAALVGDTGSLFPITAALVLIWLLLPPVRAAYWQRVQSPLSEL